MVPEAVGVGAAPGEQGGDAAGERVALAAAALEAAGQVDCQRRRVLPAAASNIIMPALLHDHDAAQRAGQSLNPRGRALGRVRIGIGRRLAHDVLPQLLELHHVGREHDLAPSTDERRVLPDKNQGVGVHDHGHAALARRL